MIIPRQKLYSEEDYINELLEKAFCEGYEYYVQKEFGFRDKLKKYGSYAAIGTILASPSGGNPNTLNNKIIHKESNPIVNVIKKAAQDDEKKQSSAKKLLDWRQAVLNYNK